MITHVLIKKTCMEMAGEYYEYMAKQDLFYARWPDQDAYIEIAWPVFIEEARASLAQMLSLPSVPQNWKDDIHEALCKHHDMQMMQRRLDNARSIRH